MTLCGVHDNMHVHTTVAHTCDYPLYLYRHTGAILCIPLDSYSLKTYSLPTKSKLYVILAICYARKCVTVVAILNIRSIMFNIDVKTCCLAYIVFSIRFLVHENL